MDEFLIALHQAALRARGGITGLADRLGKRQQTLINKLNPSDDTHQPTVGELVAIMKDGGNTAPLDELCRMFGGRFVARTRERGDSVLQSVLHAVTEQADVVRAVEESIKDGRVSPVERALIMREIAEARHALAVLENTLGGMPVLMTKGA